MPPPAVVTSDPLAERLTTIAQHILVVVFGLLPIFFVPSVIAPFAYSKVLFVLVGVFLAVILYGFALLRSGTIRLQLAWAPLTLWIIVLVALISAVLSGDMRDALIGETFEVHTTSFVALLALSASAWMVLGTNKTAIMRLFMLLAGSALVLSAFHAARLLFGADVLAFSVFAGDATLSPFGGWNDLAIFFGLSIMLSLVGLEQLRLTRLGQILFGAVVFVAVVMLAVINFFAVWMVLGLVSLVVLIYALTKDRFGGSIPMGTPPPISTVSIGISLAVLIISVVFVLGGSVVGAVISRMVNISYLEVRPSFGATTDIVRQVYDTDALFGVGPNRFGDVWRTFKDPSINESIFWNTGFSAGFGYIPTFFATTGLLGGVAWLAFLVLFVVTGVRTLLRTTNTDRVWYFIGTTSFVGGLYILAMSVIYVPGPVLLLLAALCTGLMTAAQSVLMQTSTHEINSFRNRRTGFVFIVLFLVLLISSIGALYFAGRHYAGVYLFNSSFRLMTQGVSIDALEERVIQAYTFSRDDAYAWRLAEYKIARMEGLLGVSNPTEEQRQEFNNALTGALNAAQVAVAGDATEPRNLAVLGSVYATLVSANIEGAYERSLEGMKRAQELDPRNPSRLLALGQLAFAGGKQEEARAYVELAIGMKSNYSDALFFLAQMDIAAGNTDAAIARTAAITVLEPQNPVRFFQLGVLLLSSRKFDEADTAFARAVALDGNYANARFYLALVSDALGKRDEARAHLETLLVSNPGNELLLNLLGRLGRGEPLLETAVPQESVPESAQVREGDGAVTSSTKPDTPLVSPVNVPNAESTEETQ